MYPIESLNLNSDDYLTGKVKDTSQLFTGREVIENISDEDEELLLRHGIVIKRELK